MSDPIRSRLYWRGIYTLIGLAIAVYVVVLFSLMVIGQRYHYVYRDRYPVGRTDKWTGKYQTRYGNEWVSLGESARRVTAYQEKEALKKRRLDSIATAKWEAITPESLAVIADKFLQDAKKLTDSILANPTEDSWINRYFWQDKCHQMIDSANFYIEEAKRRRAQTGEKDKPGQ